MRNKHINQICILLLGLCLFFTACKDEVPFEPELVVLPKTLFTFEEEGGDLDLTVQSNVDWTIIAQPNWVTTALTQGDYEYGVVKVSAQPNESYDRREGQIVFSSNEYSVSDTVHISQAQKDAIIVTQDSCNISSDGGKLTFCISSNVDFYIARSDAWIKQIDSRAMTDTEVTFEISPNIEKNPRSGIIYMIYRDMTEKIIINQAGYDDSVERNALIAFYKATNGDNWTNNTNWCSDKPLSEWHGVEINKKNRVIGLNLSKNNLTSRIPTELGNLTNLKKLYLNRNQLTGNIPSELGNLKNLTYLYLEQNQLTGNIPSELGNLTNLEGLFLDSNHLTGKIPSELGNLKNLEGLYLYSNQLTGNIPSELGNLKNLEGLSLDFNQLTGNIPSELGNLKNLKSLDLSINQLTGNIPSELGNLTNLKNLYLYSNQLTGNIPSELGNLTNLEYLYLYSNQLTGNIPSELGNLKNLKSLDLNQNQLTGNIPSELGNLTYLNLSLNQLTGNIPESIGNRETYAYLYIHSNPLSGEPPIKVVSHKDWPMYWSILVRDTNINLYNTKINAPEFTVIDMNGNTIISDELYKRNKVTLLFSWGDIGCPPNMQYNQTIKGLYEKYGYRTDFEILGVYCPGSETEKEYKEYIKKYIPWNNILGEKGNTIPSLSGGSRLIAVDNNKEIIFQSYTEDLPEISLILYEYFE